MRDFFTRLTDGLPLTRILATFAIGTAGGALGLLANLPLAMLLWSMLAVAVTAAAGVRVAGGTVGVPQRWRFLLIPVIGVAIGGSFTPDVLQDAPRWGLTLATLLVYIPVAHAVGYLVYARLGGIARNTAFFSAIPGGLIESLQLGEEAGADVQMLTMLQFLRLIMCIVFVPVGFALATGHPVGSSAGVQMTGADVPLMAWDIAVLLVSAVGGVWLGRLMRLPAAIISGPILLSGIAHAAGITHAVPPDWLIVVTQLVVGTSLGARFAGMTRGKLGLALWLSALNTGLVLGMAYGLALLLSGPSGMPVAAVFLAYAPGGIAEMSLVALSLQVSVVYVTLHHILRIMISVGFAQALAGRFK